jgi:MYXO-CTERM domain-containing protein
VTWNATNAVAYAELRVAAEQLYVLIWGSAAPWVTLGRLAKDGYEPLREASSNIAGPVAVGAEALVLLDGKLDALADDAMLDARGDYVTCLGGELGQAYACAHGNVLRVEQSGLGEPLFELASLREPDYQGLPEAAQLDCATRWLDVQEHVAMLTGSSEAADAGVRDAAPAEVAEVTTGAARPAGCAVSTRAAHAWWLYLVALALLIARRRTWLGSN